MNFFKKSDIAVLLCVLLISGAAFFLIRTLVPSSPACAEIYLGRELVRTVNLARPVPGRFSIDGCPEVVFEVYEDGSIAFVSSDCPDKICVHTGRLSHPWESAACIPNLVFVRLSAGNNGDGPDVISG